MQKRIAPARPFLAAATALALGGCMEVVPTESDDVTRRDSPTRFTVSSLLLRSDTDPEIFIWHIDAQLQPGLDQGLLRGSGDTLQVDGRWLAALETSLQGARHWSTRIEVPAARVSERTIVISPPQVERLSTPGPLHFTGIGPASPYTISWAPGSDIAIDLALPPALSDPPQQYLSWRLLLERGGLTRLMISTPETPPPPRLLVPGTLIPDTTALVANLDYSAYLRVSAAAGRYELTGSFRGRLDWAIEPAATPGGTAR